MNKQVDNRVVVIAFIFLICIALLAFTAYTVKLTYDINDQIGEKALAASSFRQEISRLRSIQAKSDQIDSVVAQANKKIPAQADEPGIIKFIEDITTGGALTGISFGKRADNDIATQMPFTVTMQSSYSVMMGVLRSLAESERYYSIESIDIQKRVDGELLYTISLSAYYDSNAT